MGKILIVEDDPYVRKLYQRLFSFEKFDIEMASNGEEGLVKAKSYKPDLILLDIMMPVLNGIDVLKKLKTDVETKDMIVIMLTNLGDEQTITMATKLGADGFIVKSNTEPEQLLKTVEGYLK